MNAGNGRRGWRDLVFVSYSRDDAQWVQRFKVLLRPRLDQLGMRLWIDTTIRTGDLWKQEIEDAIACSDTALLLVSARFLASSYVREWELPALRAHGVRLAPILVGRCAYQQVPELAEVQWLHDPGRDGPLSSMALWGGERDRRLHSASQKLVELLQPPRPSAGRSTTAVRGGAPGRRPLAPLHGEAGRLDGVPALPAEYVPREEVAELVAAVSAANAASGEVAQVSFGLHGPGGTGKSVVAAAVARDEGVRRRFPDGVFWVTVGDAEDVLAAQVDLLHRLAPSTRFPRSPAEAEEALREVLAARRVLLVVDDVWSDASAEAFGLAGPQGRVLYTTRDARILAGVEAGTVAIGALDLATARSVAAAVLSGAGPSAAQDRAALPAAANRAIEQVGRVALAVTLVAAAVRGGRTWEAVAAELVADADVFGRHPYANAFKAMQLGVAVLPADRRDALWSLAVFSRDARVPFVTVTRYWQYTRRYPSARTRSVLEELAAAVILSFDGEHIEFHDLQHEYLLLHAPRLAQLHGELLAAHRRLLPDGRDWSQLSADEPYLWDHLVAHLRGAGAWEELRTTVVAPTFVAHRLTAGLLVTEGNLADAARALPEDPTISWWRAWLPRHADVLTVPAAAGTGPARLAAITPTLLAWLEVDPTRPAAVDPRPLRRLCPSPYLAVVSGLRPRPVQHLRALPGHNGGVSAFAWSPDGTRIATAARSQLVRVWQVRTGDATTLPDTRDARWLAWSPRRRLLAVARPSEQLQLWDPDTRRATSLPGTRGATHVVWSPDGSRLATAFGEFMPFRHGAEADVQVWDVGNGEAVTLPETRGTTSVAWSPDGAHLATAHGDLLGRGQKVRVWDLTTRQAVTLSGTRGALRLVWSPVGTRLATARFVDRALQAQVWDPRTGQTTTTAESPDARSLVWSPDGTRLAFDGHGPEGAEVRLWDPTTGLVNALPGTRGATVLAWSYDSTRVATTGSPRLPGGREQDVRVWDPDTGHAVTLPGTRDVDTLAWCPEDVRLATGSAGGRGQDVRVWDPGTGQSATLSSTPGPTVLTWSPDGTRLATIAVHGEEVRIWAADSLRPDSDRPWRTNRISTWSPDGTRVALSPQHRGRDIRVTQPRTRETFTLPDDANMLAWSPDGTRLATGRFKRGRPVRIWDLRARHATALSDSQDADIFAWSPDGTRLAAARHKRGQPVRIWDLGTDQAVTLPDNDGADVLAWSPDGTRLAARHYQDVRLWDPDTATATPLPDGRGVYFLAWSPDGTHLAGGALGISRGPKVRVWDVRTGRVTKLADTHGAGQLAWSPDGRWLATTGRWISLTGYRDEGGEGEVRVWDARTGQIVTLPDSGGDDVMVWSPDSTRLATIDSRSGIHRHGVRVWDPTTGAVTALPDTDGARAPAWSRDGTRLATTNLSGALLVVDVDHPTRSTRISVGALRGLVWTADQIYGELNREFLVLELRNRQ